MPFIPGFIPSVNGLHFTNDFPSEPDITIASPVGPIGIGDASNGLCGGMVFTVLDIYTALLPPIPDLTQPSPQPVARAFQLTAFASDPNTGGAVNGADVLFDGKKVGVTGAPFSTTISEKVQAAIMGGGGGGTGRKVPTPPAGIVRAQNYADTEIVWNVPGGEVL